MTTLLHWWYVHATQAPYAGTCNEEGSLAEKIVTWEIESSGNGETSWPLLKVGEFLQIITCRKEHECSEKQKVTIQFHQVVGAGGQRSNCAEGKRAPLVGKLNLRSCHTAVQPQTNDGRLWSSTNTQDITGTNKKAERNNMAILYLQLWSTAQGRWTGFHVLDCFYWVFLVTSVKSF